MLRLSTFTAFACVFAVLSVIPPGLAQQRFAATLPILGHAAYDQDTVLSDFENIQNSIVRILLPQDSGPPRHNGTGFLIASDVVATSRHVAGINDRIVVGFLDGETTRFVDAEPIAESKEADLSLFRLKTPAMTRPLRVAKFAPGVGTRVAAVGFPQLVDRIMIAGTPALTEGSIVQIGNGGHVLLHHAMLRPGNSGGPLLVRTPCGSVVVGVNTHIWADSTSYGYAESYYAARAAVDVLELAEKHRIKVAQVDGHEFCSVDARIEQTFSDKPPLITPVSIELAALSPTLPADPNSRIRPPQKFRSADMISLLRRAEDGLIQGNVSAARLLLERAQRAGDPDATLLLAKTYDPDMLARWGVRGTRGDPARARVLYDQAHRLGAESVGMDPERALDLGADKITAPKPEEPVKASPPPPPVVAALPPREEPAPKTPAPDLLKLLKRAEQDIRLGNVSAARLILQRIHLANDPHATLLLAKTYDPFELARWGVRGMRPDPVRARRLYEQALKLGVAEARVYLESLP